MSRPLIQVGHDFARYSRWIGDHVAVYLLHQISDRGVAIHRLLPRLEYRHRHDRIAAGVDQSVRNKSG